MVIKNRGRFSFAALLTTLICSQYMTVDLLFGFYGCNFEIRGACNTPLERYFQDLSTGILKAPNFLQFQLVESKTSQMCSTTKKTMTDVPSKVGITLTTLCNFPTTIVSTTVNCADIDHKMALSYATL